MRVLGLSELIRDMNAVDRDLSRELRAELKDIADVGARDAAARLERLSPHSASGIIGRVRSNGLVTVEQKFRKKTGMRPDWGVTQMREAFLPSADKLQHDLGERAEETIDHVARSHGF